MAPAHFLWTEANFCTASPASRLSAKEVSEKPSQSAYGEQRLSCKPADNAFVTTFNRADELSGYRPGSIAAYLNSPGGPSYAPYPYEYGR